MTEAPKPMRTLPARTPATLQRPADDGVQIPRVLHRCLTTLAPVPERFFVECHERWRQLNPDFELRWYDFEHCRDMLASASDPRLLRAWDKLIPNSWRWFVLREHGGVYADAPFTVSVGLSEWLPACVATHGHQLVTARGWAPLSDGSPARKRRFSALLMSYVAVTPQHPLIAAALERAVQHVLDEYYGEHQTSPTGPLMFGRVVHEVLGLSGEPEDHLRVGRNEHGNLSFFVLDDLCEDATSKDVRHFTLPGQSEVLLSNRYDLEEYRALRRVMLGGQARYYDLWRRREVYRP
jgi:hypothetical protein